MIEFVRWRVRLALVRYRALVADREDSVTWKYQTYGWPWRWLRDLMDTVVSPFDPWVGYRRQPLRALLWKVSHPTATMRLASLRWSLKLLTAATPYVGRGKFEGVAFTERLQVEWLYDHTEEAEDMIGSLDRTSWVAWLFSEIDVPWSRKPETWIITEDNYGFVVGSPYEDDAVARGIFERDRRSVWQAPDWYDAENQMAAGE